MKTLKSNFTEKNANKFFKMLKVLFAFEVVLYLGILVFAVSVSTNRGQIQQGIKNEQIEVVALEKSFYDLRKGIIEQSKLNINEDIASQNKNSKMIEYVYADKILETASR